MAKLTTEELIEAFKELTLIELSEFVKAFEETSTLPLLPRPPLPLLLPPALPLKRLKRRTSSTSFSRLSATRRLVSSRRCAP